ARAVLREPAVCKTARWTQEIGAGEDVVFDRDFLGVRGEIACCAFLRRPAVRAMAMRQAEELLRAAITAIPEHLVDWVVAHGSQRRRRGIRSTLAIGAGDGSCGGSASTRRSIRG